MAVINHIWLFKFKPNKILKLPPWAPLAKSEIFSKTYVASG